MSTEPITHAQLARQAAFIAERAANWAACLIGPLPNRAEPVDSGVVARFVAQIRERLDIIETWDAPAVLNRVGGGGESGKDLTVRNAEPEEG